MNTCTATLSKSTAGLGPPSNSLSRHVIGYLLERGAFDTNTLFMSESNVKPPQFNKTEEPVEVKARHRYLPYNYAPTYIPK